MADYTFPDYIVIKEDGFSRSEGVRFTASAPASGPYYSQIISDDVPMIFNLELVAKTHADALNFRQWLIQNNYDIMTGAQFNIRLWTEYGYTTQVASFMPDAMPQLTQTIRNLFFYSARIVVQSMSRGGEAILAETTEIIETEAGPIVITEEGSF